MSGFLLGSAASIELPDRKGKARLEYTHELSFCVLNFAPSPITVASSPNGGTFVFAPSFWRELKRAFFFGENCRP
jgi:hypothetical protein